MIFFVLIVISLFLLGSLVAVGSIKTEENKCPYKGACSPTTCPYWKRCELKDTFDRY